MQVAERIADITDTPNSRPAALHTATDTAKRAALAADMETHGWVGAPIVTLSEHQALTGSHRLAAAADAGLDRVPQISIADLCTAYDLDWDSVQDEYDGDWYWAAAALRERLPQEVVDYLGYDVDGE